MERIVKFRGKRIDTGEWVYGSYHPHKEVMLCIASKEQVESNLKALIIQDGMSDWNLTVPINTHEVIPKSVGEFTGLKDKNGKEIYEGDICQYYDKKYYIIEWALNIGGMWLLSTIKYDNGPHGMGFEETEQYELEVIGNIFENPELLKT